MTELQNCKLVINGNAHDLYSACKRVAHDKHGIVKAVKQTDRNNEERMLYLGYTLLRVETGDVRLWGSHRAEP